MAAASDVRLARFGIDRSALVELTPDQHSAHLCRRPDIFRRGGVLLLGQSKIRKRHLALFRAARDRLLLYVYFDRVVHADQLRSAIDQLRFS